MKRSSTSGIKTNTGSASKTVRGGKKAAGSAKLPRAGKTPGSN